MRKIILLTILLLSSLTAMGQEAKTEKKTNVPKNIGIRSTVIDNFTGYGLGDAEVTVFDEKGDTIKEFRFNDKIMSGIVITWADKNKGATTLYSAVPRKSGRYRFRVECKGYKPIDRWHNIKIVRRMRSFEIPPFEMQKDFKQDSIARDMELEEVVVKATKIKFYHKGDTLIYNADAFNLPESSMLDDLIRQLPGATINDNGEIHVNGKKIDMLTLNGKQFFGHNNKLMLDNLPYYTVEKIKVFDQTTELSMALGHDVEDKIHTMDVQLKKEYSIGYFGNVGVGGGTQDRWLARAFGMRFTDNSRVSFFLNSNNVNEHRKPGSDSNWQPSDLMAGLQHTHRGGLDINIWDNYDKYEDKGFITASWTKTMSESRTAGENFLTTGNAYSRAKSAGEQRNLSIDLDNTFTFKKPWYVKLQTNGGYSKYRNETGGMSASFSSDPDKFGDVSEVLDSLLSASSSESLRGITVNRSISEALSKGDSWNVSQSVHTAKSLLWGDDFEAGASVSYRNATAKDWNRYNLDYIQNPSISADHRNRYNSLPSHSYNYSANALYRFNFFDLPTTTIKYKYDQSYNYSDENRYRLEQIADWDGALGSLPSTLDWMQDGLDADNSKTIGSMNKTHTVEVNIRKGWKAWGTMSIGLDLTLPLALSNERMRYSSSALDTTMTRKHTLFNPIIQLKLDGRNKKDAKWSYHNILSYQKDTRPANLLQMIPVKDTYNPLSQNQGNSSLKNTTTHNTFLNINSYRGRLTLLHGVGFTIIENDVAMGFTYNPTTGVYSYRPENVNGNWSARYYNHIWAPLDKANKWGFEHHLMSTYSRQIDLSSVSADPLATGSIRSKVNNINVNYEMKLTYSFEKLRVGAVGSVNYRNTTSDRTDFRTLNAYDFNYGLNGQYTMPLGLTIATDMKMYCRRGYGSSAMNTNDFVWNASLSRSFLKDKLTATLQAFDLLHQLSQTTYTVNSQGRTETWQRSLPNYLMLTLQWKYNVNPKKEKK